MHYNNCALNQFHKPVKFKYNIQNITLKVRMHLLILICILLFNTFSFVYSMEESSNHGSESEIGMNQSNQPNPINDTTLNKEVEDITILEKNFRELLLNNNYDEIYIQLQDKNILEMLKNDPTILPFAMNVIKYPTIIETLIKKGINVSYTDENNNTIFHLLTKSPLLPYYRITRALIKRFPNIQEMLSKKNNNNKTAYKIAKEIQQSHAADQSSLFFAVNHKIEHYLLKNGDKAYLDQLRRIAHFFNSFEHTLKYQPRFIKLLNPKKWTSNAAKKIDKRTDIPNVTINITKNQEAQKIIKDLTDEINKRKEIEEASLRIVEQYWSLENEIKLIINNLSNTNSQAAIDEYYIAKANKQNRVNDSGSNTKNNSPISEDGGVNFDKEKLNETELENKLGDYQKNLNEFAQFIISMKDYIAKKNISLENFKTTFQDIDLLNKKSFEEWTNKVAVEGKLLNKVRKEWIKSEDYHFSQETFDRLTLFLDHCSRCMFKHSRIIKMIIESSNILYSDTYTDTYTIEDLKNFKELVTVKAIKPMESFMKCMILDYAMQIILAKAIYALPTLNGTAKIKDIKQWIRRTHNTLHPDRLANVQQTEEEKNLLSHAAKLVVAMDVELNIWTNNKKIIGKSYKEIREKIAATKKSKTTIIQDHFRSLIGFNLPESLLKRADELLSHSTIENNENNETKEALHKDLNAVKEKFVALNKKTNLEWAKYSNNPSNIIHEEYKKEFDMIIKMEKEIKNYIQKLQLPLSDYIDLLREHNDSKVKCLDQYFTIANKAIHALHTNIKNKLIDSLTKMETVDLQQLGAECEDRLKKVNSIFKIAEIFINNGIEPSNINSKRQTEETEKNTKIENIVQQILPNIAYLITHPKNMLKIKNYKKNNKLYAWAKGIIRLFDLAKSDQIRGNSEDTKIEEAYTFLTELLKSQNDTNNVTHSKAQPNLNDINKKSNISNKSTSTNQPPNKESRKTPSNKGFHAAKEGTNKEEKNKKRSTPPQKLSSIEVFDLALTILLAKNIKELQEKQNFSKFDQWADETIKQLNLENYEFNQLSDQYIIIAKAREMLSKKKNIGTLYKEIIRMRQSNLSSHVTNNKNRNKNAGLLDAQQNNDAIIQKAFLAFLGTELSFQSLQKAAKCLGIQSSVEKEPRDSQNPQQKNQSPPPQSTSFFNSHSIPLIIGGTIITLGGLYGAYKMLKTSQTYTS